MKKITLFILILLYVFPCVAKPPSVDISFLVADIKFSQEHGVKICEIQHGSNSAFMGDRLVHGDNGLIAPNFQRVMSSYSFPKWTSIGTQCSPTMKQMIQSAADWILINPAEITNDSLFLEQAIKPFEDSNDISKYNGLIYFRQTASENVLASCQGIIAMDLVSFPYWRDKYQMSELFTHNQTLSLYKPAWGLYSKNYTPELTRQIIEDIPSDLYVIKPRGSTLGNGVIIVSRENLDSTLQYILIKNAGLLSDTDKSYNYWLKDPYDSLLIEKFYPSDLIAVEHLDSKIFHPTLRVAFILMLNQCAIQVHFLGSYWILPSKSIDEEGTLNQTMKAFCHVPFYANIDPGIETQVYNQLSIALPLLYQEMISSFE